MNKNSKLLKSIIYKKENSNNFVACLLKYKSNGLNSLNKSNSINIDYGSKILSKALSTICLIEQKLDELKEIVNTSRLTTDVDLKELNDLYQKGENEINEIIYSQDYLGVNLFNHNGLLDINITLNRFVSNRTIKISLPDLRSSITGIIGTTALVDQCINDQHILIANKKKNDFAWGYKGVSTAEQNQIAAISFLEDLTQFFYQVTNFLNEQIENLKQLYLEDKMKYHLLVVSKNRPSMNNNLMSNYKRI